MAMPCLISLLLCSLLPQTAGVDPCTAESEIEVNLLQADLSIGSSALRPLGRSFYSTDPKSSAAWWLRYSTAEPLPLQGPEVVGLGESEDSAAVLVKSWLGAAVERLYFLRAPDWRGPWNQSMVEFVKAAELSWASVMSRQQGYTPWVDFHDGHSQITMNTTRFIEDQQPFQYYKGVSRAYIPNTTWTMEWLGGQWAREPLSAYILASTYKDPDTCRNNTGFEVPNRTFWKSTFAVADARRAQSFAIRVLGAQHLGDPYPWPPRQDCIAAQWVVLQPSALQLHFVENSVYHSMLLNISDFLSYQQDFLQGHKGCINSFMLNNLVLETWSLDPFIQRLEDEAAPYFVFDLGTTYALLFSFPGNEGVTMQIQGSRVTRATPQPLKLCS